MYDSRKYSEEFEALEYQHQIGWKVSRDVGSYHPSYDECDCCFSNTLKERAKRMSSLPSEKIEDIDEFKDIFCREAKLVVNLTNEEILERIHKLEKFVRHTRTRISKDKDELAHRKEKMSKSERDALEIKDRAYKVKPVVETEKPKAVPKSKEEKAIDALMAAMGFTREQAINFMKKGTANG
jgi:uncharacterized protein YcnI